jgi:hypothetical protein
MRKKVLFMLILAMTGIAGVNAQMRISGEVAPNTSAVLDLNPDDNVSAGNATLGLALPRVNLRNSSDAFPLLSHVKGMTIYNLATVSDVKPGVYVNNGMKWLRQADSETLVSVLEKDSIVGNEITDATAAGSLVRSGAGTAASPFTLDVANGGITAEKIPDNAITTRHIEDRSVTMEKLQIPGAPIRIEYNESTSVNSAGWTNLGYANQTIPAGLYVATVHIDNGSSIAAHEAVKYTVLDAGGQYVYTLSRKYAEALGDLAFDESCVIFVGNPNSSIRLFVYTIYGRLESVNVSVILRPLIQLN